MADTFTCDNCGKEFPSDQMKEVKIGDSDQMLKLDPGCLDEKMEESDEVYGIEGEEKRRAAFLASDDGEQPAEPVTGKRESE